MILAQTISYHHHVFWSEAIEADVEVEQHEVPHEELAELPGRLGALKLLVGRMPKLCRHIFFLLEIVLDDGPPDGARSY